MDCDIYDNTDYGMVQFVKIEHLMFQVKRMEHATI